MSTRRKPTYEVALPGVIAVWGSTLRYPKPFRAEIIQTNMRLCVNADNHCGMGNRARRRAGLGCVLRRSEVRSFANAFQVRQARCQFLSY